MSTDAEQTYICDACSTDKFVKEFIRSEGEQRTCTYCEKIRHGITLNELADHIHEVLQKYFFLTSSEPEGIDYALAKEGLWERPGEPVQYVISEIAGLSEEIAAAVQEYLSDQFGYEAAKESEEDPYGSDALYEARSIDDSNFQDSWGFFRNEIRTRARFFSAHAQRALDEIFGDLNALRTIYGKRVIQAIRPSSRRGRNIYRARVCFSDKELIEILKSPVEGIGPPPSRKATAGRMNASGISVFYGALDKKTCIAEARAPVGSQVVIGRFEIIRPVRLLDFDALTRVYVEGSHFDPSFDTRRSRAVFLRRLVNEISRPVMPRDEEFEYLPTQAVSEYLADRFEPRLDGILFHSSQTAGKGQNIVLFNHACRVEPYDLLEGTEINIDLGTWFAEDDFDESINISEIVPDKSSKTSSKEKPGASFAIENVLTEPPDEDEEDVDSLATYRDPTLRLDIPSIGVFSIRTVHYEASTRNVRRYRLAKSKDAKF